MRMSTTKHIIGMSVAWCPEATFQRDMDAEEELIHKVGDVLRRCRAIEDGDRASLMSDANSILQLMVNLYKNNDTNKATMESLHKQLVDASSMATKKDDQLASERQLTTRLYKTNDDNNATIKKLQHQLADMSTTITEQEEQLMKERKGFGRVVKKLNKKCDGLEVELRLKDSMIQALERRTTVVGGVCCSSSTITDTTHEDEESGSNDSSPKPEDSEGWKERYDELIDKTFQLVEENSELSSKCNELEEEIALSKGLPVPEEYAEALVGKIDELQKENDELNKYIDELDMEQDGGMYDMIKTFEDEIAMLQEELKRIVSSQETSLMEQVEKAALSKKEAELILSSVKEQSKVLEIYASFDSDRLDREEDECSSHVDFLLSQNRNDEDLEKPRTTVAEPVNEDLDDAIFVTSKGKPWHVDNDKNQSLVDSVLDTTRVS